jgi:hypothetical protein
MISSNIRPPVMMLLGLPWGPLASWDAAGKCFITLAAAISLLVALCLYLLLRIGVKPFFLVLAAMCVGASLGPYPHAGEIHNAATGFMADSLLAWTTLAALLLIPYEARTPCPLIRGAVLRGIIWGSILSLGVMTKLSFLYFTGLIAAVLFLVHFNRNGYRSTVAAIIGFAFSSAPAAVYLLLYGRRALAAAMAGSFGTVSYLGIPILRFLSDTIRDSPGLLFSFTLTAAALIYLLIGRRSVKLWPDFAALLILIGFGIVALKSPNRQIRYEFPVIVPLPFLTAILLSGKRYWAPRPAAALAAGLVFCGLLTGALPMLHRANRESLAMSDAILAQAAQCSAKHITLATDSPALNVSLVGLALMVSSNHSIEVGGLPTADVQKVLGVVWGNDTLRAEKGFYRLRESDQVVFQNINALLQTINPSSDRVSVKMGSIFYELPGLVLRRLNQRAAEYEQYLRQSGYVPVKVDDDINVYSIQCRR